MRRALLISTMLACMAEGVGAQPAPNSINISVRDSEGRPIATWIQFRRSSAERWGRLDRTGADGQVQASLVCAPGMTLKATPSFEYYDSDEAACRPTVPLIVRPRHYAVLPSLRSNVAVTQVDLASALGALELVEAGSARRYSPQEARLARYIAHPSGMTRAQVNRVETDLLNQSSNLFSRLDLDRNGVLTPTELRAAATMPDR